MTVRSRRRWPPHQIAIIMSRNHDQSLLRASTDARAQLAIDDYAYLVNQEIDHLAVSLSLGDAANLGNAWRINDTHNARPAGPPGHADERAGAAPAGRELHPPTDTSDNLAHFITMCASFRPTTCHYTLNQGL